MIFINLNLPPDLRYQIKNILAGIIIPGPRQPKDYNSFLRPLVDELELLGNGSLSAMDGDTGEMFTLRAHVLIVTGDGPATASAMGMKRPGNAFRPCRACEISGVRGKHVYYLPHSECQHNVLCPRLNLRAVIEDVHIADANHVRMLTGINSKSELLRLHSIHFPRSFPGDIMHNILLRVCPMLFDLWIGEKLATDKDRRGADPPRQQVQTRLPSYRLSNNSLKSISNALAESRQMIPMSLGHAPRRIDKHHNGYTAAEWKAWLLYYGPPLLWKKLDESYLANFRDLGDIFRLATAQEVWRHHTHEIRDLAWRFVRSYEQLYYRQEDDRLPVCTINIHSILHYADWIRDLGPACYFWQFPMERFCRVIKPQARSKSMINTSIANSLILTEHLNHLQFLHADFADGETSQPNEMQCTALRGILKSSPANEPTPYQRRTLQIARNAPFTTMDCYKQYQLATLVIGSRKSQSNGNINRENCRIAYRPTDNSPWKFGVVQYFAHTTDSNRCDDWALVKQLTGRTAHLSQRVIAFGMEGSQEWVPVEQIRGLIGLLHERDSRFFMVVSDLDIFTR